MCATVHTLECNQPPSRPPPPVPDPPPPVPDPLPLCQTPSPCARSPSPCARPPPHIYTHMHMLNHKKGATLEQPHFSFLYNNTFTCCPLDSSSCRFTTPTGIFNLWIVACVLSEWQQETVWGFRWDRKRATIRVPARNFLFWPFSFSKKGTRLKTFW